jgi:hypothetical protein
MGGSTESESVIMPEQTVSFQYQIRERVWITELARPGRVVGLYYGETGQQYQISYFDDGEKKTTYLYSEDIVSEDKHRGSAGFSLQKKEEQL